MPNLRFMYFRSFICLDQMFRAGWFPSFWMEAIWTTTAIFEIIIFEVVHYKIFFKIKVLNEDTRWRNTIVTYEAIYLRGKNLIKVANDSWKQCVKGDFC